MRLPSRSHSGRLPHGKKMIINIDEYVNLIDRNNSNKACFIDRNKNNQADSRTIKGASRRISRGAVDGSLIL